MHTRTHTHTHTHTQSINLTHPAAVDDAHKGIKVYIAKEGLAARHLLVRAICIVVIPKRTVAHNG